MERPNVFATALLETAGALTGSGGCCVCVRVRSGVLSACVYVGFTYYGAHVHFPATMGPPNIY